MNSAEYKALREACGLSQEDAALFHNVGLWMLAEWERGGDDVPPTAIEELQRLDAALERAVLEAIDHVEEVRDQKPGPAVVALSRYRTKAGYDASRAGREGLLHACHDALIARTAAALRRVGAVVTIVWAD